MYQTLPNADQMLILCLSYSIITVIVFKELNSFDLKDSIFVFPFEIWREKIGLMLKSRNLRAMNFVKPQGAILKSIDLTKKHKIFILSSTGSSVQRTPSNRSTASTASSLISLEPIMDETTGDASATADVTDTATIQTGSEDENRYSQNTVAWPKLYIPSTLNIDLILWHTQWIVYAVKC